MKRMLNRMLRYADAIVKRGVDKLIDAIGQSPEPQTKNAETPQPQKSMGNSTDCAPQITGSTTDGGLTEQSITLMDELYDIRYNVLDRTPEVQRRDQADKGFVSVGKLVCNTMVIYLHKRGCMVWNNDVYRNVESKCACSFVLMSFCSYVLRVSGISHNSQTKIHHPSFGFGRERPERPKAPSPGQAKRHPGYRVLEQSRPVRAKALRHGAAVEQNIHTMFHLKTAKSAIK